MRVFKVLFIGVFFMFSSLLFAAEKTTVFNVKGMGWPGRAYKVSSALKKVNGVIKAEADYKKHTVKVIFNDSTVKSETLKKKIESLGFKVVK